MGEVKQIEIKNRIYYFYNDMINLKLVKNRQKTLQRDSYLLYWIHYN